MKILLLGSGGREHALALKLKASSTPVELVSAPGSDALAELGARVVLDAEDPKAVADWCALSKPDLVIIGPEAPLVSGVADAIRAMGIPAFGHGQKTAQLEGSKAFAKAFMHRHNIPCAASVAVKDLAAGEAAIKNWKWGLPIVLKADGLAAGKGVVLATSEAEALDTLRSFLDGAFGEASKTIVLEAPLLGMELSLHVLVDVDAGHARYLTLPACQDHKRIFEGDNGPNTGGMGVFGPIPFLREEDMERMRRDLVEPTVRGLQKDGLAARGVLFLGVMWTAAGPQLLEYNCRFGDPETQVLMQLLDEDLPALLLSVAKGELLQRNVKVKPGCAITVVLAAEGYPDAPKKGVPIEIGRPASTLIHAGTKRADGRWTTNGGRVLNLATSAPTLAEARAKVATDLVQVAWPGMQARRDIGLKALKHAEAGKTVQDPW
ncbi:MAG TPA: phosphoribosylamine--glycine ligase [Holophagaceae bacterium]|jgi:phosphoribosylamine--glycine ligase|nr:phosphoribosylamine--glycine ligase [Holophagaceae bacterium]